MALEQLANKLRIIGGFELSLAEFTGSSFSVTGEATAAQGVTFSDDGASMFVLDEQTESVFQYSLTTGFDVSTASFSGTSFDVSGEETIPRGIAFNADGTRMFIIGQASNSVHQYSLTTGFDLSTASFSGTSFDVSGEESQAEGVAFNADGTRMFVIGTGSNSVHQYSLTNGFDLSTASFSGTSFDVSSQDTNPRDVAFNADGTRMFIIGDSSDSVHQYSLTTDFDVSTASFSGTSFDVSSQDTNPRDVAFTPDGVGMFIAGEANDSVFEYLVGRLRLQS